MNFQLPTTPNRTGKLLCLLLVMTGVAAILTWRFALSYGLSDVSEKLREEMVLSQRAVESGIERFRYLPRVLAEDARVRAAIDNPSDAGAIDGANRYLQTVAAKSSASHLYVVGPSGRTLAASNWNTDESFVGQNYRFRPYFLNALTHGEGRFYAIGVTTGKPGYFLSYRLDTPGGGLGVVVVKIELQSLEETWRKANLNTAIADEHGVVFLSGNPQWKYRPLLPLSDEALDTINRQRTFDGVDINRAEPLFDEARFGSLLSLREAAPLMETPDSGELLAGFTSMPTDHWTLIAASGTSAARELAAFYAAMVGLGGLLMSGLILYVRQRRQLIQLRLDQNEVLEARVDERTRELAREISQRIRTEQELRETQESLIQAAKLAALGRMSAAIVHEISQPLSAMDATLAAGSAYSTKGDVEKVNDRLAAARGLVKRLQRTVKHLKTFARKEKSTPEAVDLPRVIEAAIELAAPRIHTLGASVAFTPPLGLPPVHANALRLEQVFLNLILNALDAMEETEQRQMTVTISCQGDIIEARVSDSGAGIPPEVQARLKEPFFTTKTVNGLGLGLSISHAIIEEFAGELTFTSDVGKGTTAVVRLPRAHTAAALREAAE